MSRRSRARQVEIFNFSFLDILACTIGLLIFIMVMVVILQSGSAVADTGQIVAQKLKQAIKFDSAAQRDVRIAQSLEAQLDSVKPSGQPDLAPRRDAARAARDVAQLEANDAAARLAAVETALDAARLTRAESEQHLKRATADLVAGRQRLDRATAALAAAKLAAKKVPLILSVLKRPGAGSEHYNILHVDCRAKTLVLMAEQDGKLSEIGQTPLDELDQADSDFQRQLAQYSKMDNPLVLFWVRPDGDRTFGTAIEKLPAGMARGYEPADAQWHFANPAQ
jgi:hypothetical protein